MTKERKSSLPESSVSHWIIGISLVIGAWSLVIPPGESQFQLNAEFDDLTRGKLEVTRGGPRNAREEDEELLAPRGHAPRAVGEQQLAALVEAHVALLGDAFVP